MAWARSFAAITIYSSAVILGQGQSDNLQFEGMADALAAPQTQLRLFGKPDINGRRRLGVSIARRETIEQAIESAVSSADKIKIAY